MSIGQVLLTVIGVIYIAATVVIACAVIICAINEKEKSISGFLPVLFAPLIVIAIPFILLWLEYGDYFADVIKDGGFIKHHRKVKKRMIEEEQRRLEKEAAKIEYNRIKALYLKGEIQRTELPRVENGEDQFEFSPEMNISSEKYGNPGEIVYIENGYCHSLNSFFIRNKDFRLFNMYKFVYLPNLCKDIIKGELLHFLYPNLSLEEKIEIDIDSTYPLQYLVYQEDACKIKHGMIYFIADKENHGAKYIKGHYYPLEEGDDEYVAHQLDAIVRAIHNEYGEGGLYSAIEKPEIEEGSTDDYADELFPWMVANDEVAVLVKDIREKIKVLKEMGIGESLIMKIIKEKPKLSRLVITKDYRILLPDYNNMEIKMEPLVKAVYLLFLNHPEGIIFKHLPDYREELTRIYVKMKPNGMSDKVLQSIEDVTNPCLNSINEKCARVRGSFFSQFNGELAGNYCIWGMRGEAKKISLPRDMVVWE